jgi:hypothetical protein
MTVKDLPIIFSAPMVRSLIAGDKNQTRRLAKSWLKVKAGYRMWVREAHHVQSAGYQDGTGKLILYRASDPDAPTTWTPGIHMPRFASRLTLEATADARLEKLQAITRADAIAEGATMRSACYGFRSMDNGWSMDWSQVGKWSRFGSGPHGALTGADVALADPRNAFGSFINELHGGPRWNLKPTNLWDENPEVVVLTFKVHTANVDQLSMQEAA